MTEKKKHALFDRPYLGGIVAMLITYLAVFIFATIPAIVLGKLTGVDENTLMSVIAIPVSIIALVIHTLRFKGDNYKGCFTRSKFPQKEIMVIVGITFVIDIIISFAGKNLVMPSLIAYIPAFYAGIMEETVFRAIPLSIMMKNKPTDKRMILAVIITTLIFGLQHVVNIAEGATVFNTIIQIIFALGPGIFFAAIYLRTGSIIIPMIYHAAHDILSLFQNEGSYVLDKDLALARILPEFCFIVFLVGVGIFLLRKSKWQEIKNIWADIWSE